MPARTVIGPADRSCLAQTQDRYLVAVTARDRHAPSDCQRRASGR
jgi:hypothetical protein